MPRRKVQVEGQLDLLSLNKEIEKAKKENPIPEEKVAKKRNIQKNKKNNNECAKESRPASGYAGNSPKIIYERTVCRSCTNGRR